MNKLVVMRVALLYCFVFLPMHFLIGFLEGVARADWSFTLRDLSYQSGAWAAFIAGSLLVLAIPTIPLLAWAVVVASRRLAGRYHVAAGLVVGPVVLLLVAVVLSLLTTRDLDFVQVLLAFPSALIVPGAILGFGSMRAVENEARPAAA
jgi:hypothetical protein